MSDEVKTPNGRAARTEARVVSAATALFLERGYQGTTLADVAAAAGVGARTVYVRFGTKAALLRRAIDVALVGDTLPIDVAHRDWSVTAMTAPTLHERVAAQASGGRALMERVGPLLAVAGQAEPVEAEIAAAAQAGREETVRQVRAFWAALGRDGLLHPGADPDWAGATTALLATADTYLLITRTLRWTPAEYETWIHRTWMHLATTPGPA
ncbi:TetR family transcriptional regulator [Pseudonocardia sediminis]|uniref:TetR family transcriptional regulator n=1 Tax=Pseudonocardia sediminis TaxID=1397368 RepID=A0A4Q7UT03_PSEST|nr:TetR family transcriptional regulator [Pseudonocardia sediminis]RZT85017.1 TetR family transcriptional regulator [Pseudonocardia sediminis]